MAQLLAEVVGLRGQVAVLEDSSRRCEESMRRCEADLARLLPANEDSGQVLLRALRSVGVLNHQTPEVSGEARFLLNFAAQMPEVPVLDVGANTGQFAELLRQSGTRGMAHCFEPHQVSFAALAACAGEWGLRLHRLAPGETTEEIELFNYEDEAGSQHASVYRGVIEGIHRRPAATSRVCYTWLDDWAAEWGGRIDLLKIAPEGHELDVLKSARGLLAAKAAGVIQFEFNEMNVISRVFLKDFFDLLPDYRVCRLLPDRAMEFQACDPGIIGISACQNIACSRRDIDPHWLLSA